MYDINQIAELWAGGDRLVSPGYLLLHQVLDSYYSKTLTFTDLPPYIPEEEAIRRWMVMHTYRMNRDWLSGMSDKTMELMERGW